MDHWRYPKDRELAPLRRDPTPEKYVRPPRGPRLHMGGYTYPAEFDIGVYERVRTLNILLQNYYRRIGEVADDVSEKTEVYNNEKEMLNSLNDYNHRQMKNAEEKLKGYLSQTIPLLAELDAIGAPHHIPDQLKDKIQMKEYVPFGSLAYLPGVNFYHSEQMEDVPNATANQKKLLKRISFTVNRATFLQECGHVFRERLQYAGSLAHERSDSKQVSSSGRA